MELPAPGLESIQQCVEPGLEGHTVQYDLISMFLAALQKPKAF